MSRTLGTHGFPLQDVGEAFRVAPGAGLEVVVAPAEVTEKGSPT